MSIDVADELHSADDQATTALAALERLHGIASQAVIDFDTDDERYKPLEDEFIAALDEAKRLIDAGYCRCFCAELAAEDDEWEPDDCCGCPCHNEEGG